MICLYLCRFNDGLRNLYADQTFESLHKLRARVWTKFCESSGLFYLLVLILISNFLRYSTYELGIFQANRTTKCLRNEGRTKGECLSTAN